MIEKDVNVHSGIMRYRKLGKTDIDVSIIGLGTEYLNRKSRKTVVSVVHEAIERGVNYFDIIFAFSDYRDNFGTAFKGHRDKVIIAGHLGCAETNGQYRLTRDVKENEILFKDLLSRLHTDYVDILMIQMVNNIESYEQIMRSGGLMELSLRFQEEGKARFIGMSGHKIPAALKAIIDGHIDVLMFPINVAWDFTPGRKEVYKVCDKKGVGIVGMKVFAGGRIFHRKGALSITPTQCINYVLSQPGVSTVVPGVKNERQLEKTLHFLEANDAEMDFTSVIIEFQEDLKGNCVYCNHCLPCPVSIDIGHTFSMLDKALLDTSSYKAHRGKINFYYPGRIRSTRSISKNHSLNASACTECGVCMERCPFDVDIISKMKQAAQFFEKQG